MNRFLFNGFIKVFLIVAVLFFSGCRPEKASQHAEKGFLDLSEWDFEKDGRVSLDGEWEFYWQKLLEPAEFSGPAIPQKTGYFDVPGYWNQYEANGKPISGDGYATFRLIIKLKPGQSPAVTTESQATAYRLWVDSRPVLHDGLVGETRQSMRPSSRVQLAPVNSENQTIQIILQVSNYYLNKGGPFHRISIGSERLLRREQTLLWAHNFLLFGGLFVIGIYHLIFYLLRRKDVTPLYFGAVCLLWCFRIPFEGMGGKFITLLFPEFSWAVSYKFELLTWYLCIPVFLNFISLLYPKESSKKILKITWITGLFFIFIVLISPSKTASYTVLPYEIISVSLGLYGFYIMTRALAHKRQGVIMMITGYSAFLLAGINDILYDNMIIYTGYFIPLGFFIMIMMQSIVLARRFAHSFATVESLSNELEEKNIILSHLDKIKDEFLANTSHELRTPLHGIIGIAESALESTAEKVSSELKSNLSLIVSSGRRLARLVNDILDFSRLKNKDITLNKKSVDIRTISEIVIKSFSNAVKKKDIEIISLIPGDCPNILGDEDRIQQILFNLIGNAVKFTEKGTIKLFAKISGSMLEISVTDTGKGIPDSELIKIFEPFEQVQDTDFMSYQGSGIGLAVTKKLVELHEGNINVDSTAGKGTTFSFSLPICEEHPEKEDNILLPGRLLQNIYIEEDKNDVTKNINFPETGPDSHVSNPWVLVVDDDPVNLRVVGNFLSTEDIPFISASNGQEAIDFFKKGGQTDLVLLDVMMPGLTGIEVCQKLREKYRTAELPIIMLTARNRISDFIRAYEYGASDYLTKPFLREELITRVRFHLKLKDAYASLHENYRLQMELLEQKLKEEKALILAEKATLEMLRYQLNPHFLFNSLASIRGAVIKDPYTARDMITNLADLCRLILSRKGKDLSSIQNEIELIQLYLDIEKVRLGDYLSVIITMEQDLANQPVPSFLLQPIVENAVKYGRQTSPDNLEVKVSAGRSGGTMIYLEVANTGTWIEPQIEKQKHSMGIGAENLKQRLEKLYTGKAAYKTIVEDGWVKIRLELPANYKEM